MMQCNAAPAASGGQSQGRMKAALLVAMLCLAPRCVPHTGMLLIQVGTVFYPHSWGRQHCLSMLARMTSLYAGGGKHSRISVRARWPCSLHKCAIIDNPHTLGTVAYAAAQDLFRAAGSCGNLGRNDFQAKATDRHEVEVMAEVFDGYD